MNFTLGMSQTLATAVILLVIGRWTKERVELFRRYFIPAPVIGGVLFSIFSLIGHDMNFFYFNLDTELRELLMIAFFTTVGFSASFKLLKKGGVQVGLFLLSATILVVIQNAVGVSMAKMFGLHPLIGVAVGSVPLTGGHGTSGAFGPILEEVGAAGALTVAIAAATYGLVAGCLIGGPVAKRLVTKNSIKCIAVVKSDDELVEVFETKMKNVTENSIFHGIVLVAIAMGIGSCLTPLVKEYLVLPPYIGTMLVAALIRNYSDYQKIELPHSEFGIIGNITLSLFLSMALMTMKLWELKALAGPLVIMLLIQTAIMAVYAYYMTFNLMGKDYDAAVISAGHCGFGLGATPNAMANMEAFTSVNGPSPHAFFVLPIVGTLFIDFVNAGVITAFINFFK